MISIKSLEISKDDALFTISTAARLLGVSVHTLRMYEREGLVIPLKDKAHRRMYSQTDIERILMIRSAINADKISISGLKTCLALIPCWEIKHCTSTPETCHVFTESLKPCWLVKKQDKQCEDKDCRECEVYIQFSNCKLLKEKLLALYAINRL